MGDLPWYILSWLRPTCFGLVWLKWCVICSIYLPGIQVFWVEFLQLSHQISPNQVAVRPETSPKPQYNFQLINTNYILVTKNIVNLEP